MSTKGELLALLEAQRGEVVSGEAAAQRLGVSRAAVWKAVKALQRQGLAVEAVPASGYRLAPGSDVLSEEALAVWLAAKTPVRVLAETASTNLLAKRWAAEDAPHGALVVAERQTAGRGRLGRQFASPPGGVYLSVVLRPRQQAAAAVRITAAAAVATCSAVARLCGCQLGIKWVNDLFYNGKKCCGILSEAGMDIQIGTMDYIVVGIGLNYTTASADLPAETRHIATALFPGGPAPVPRAQLIAEIHARLLAEFSALESGAFLEAYRARSLVLGRQVTVLADPPYTARALAIDDEARLVVESEDGRQTALSYGEISIKL